MGGGNNNSLKFVVDGVAKKTFSNGVSHSYSISSSGGFNFSSDAYANVTDKFYSTSDTFTVKKGQVIEYSTSISFTNRANSSASSYYSWNPRLVITDTDGTSHTYSIKNEGYALIEYGGVGQIVLEATASTNRWVTSGTSEWGSGYNIGRSGFVIDYTTNKIVIK